MQIAEKILRIISEAGKWYMRRSNIAKAVIIALFFILPLLIYAYTETTKELAKPIVFIGDRNAQSQQVHVLAKYRANSCNPFGGKTLYVFGHLIISDTCYAINGSVYLYELYSGYTLLKIYGNTSSSTVYIFALQRDAKVVIENETIDAQRIVIAVFADRLDPQIVREALDENGLRQDFCSVAVPSSTWSTSTVPIDIFIEVCSTHSH